MDVAGRIETLREGQRIAWHPPVQVYVGIPVMHPGVVGALTHPSAVDIWWVRPGGGYRSFHEVYDQDWLTPVTEVEFLGLSRSVWALETDAPFEGGGGGYTDRTRLPGA